MKIKLNDYEELTLKIKEVMEPPEFIEFVDRLNQIIKMMKRDFTFNDITNPTNTDKEIILNKPTRKYIKSGNYTNESLNKIPNKFNKREWCNTKEKAIKILKMYYLINDKEKRKREVENFTKDDYNKVSKGIFGLKKRYNIKPQELGLRYYPDIATRQNGDRKKIVDNAKL